MFEINRNFRNEGLSTQHNRNSMLEFYWAYADYHDLMDLTEAMFRQLARDITGAEQFIYQGLEIDFGKPFVRMSVRDSIAHYNPNLSSDDIDDIEALTAFAKTLGIECKADWGLVRYRLKYLRRPLKTS